MAFDKHRIRFRKAGDLRLVSHLDLMRCFERLFRRAAIPLRMSEGFHPAPRMIFALSLPLGVIGLEEVLEIELTEPIESEDLLNRIRVQTPPGIDFLSVRRIELKSSARPRQAIYTTNVSATEAGTVAERIRPLLETNEIWVERRRPTPKMANIRPYVNDIVLVGNRLEINLWISQEGSARAEEMATLLGLPDAAASGRVMVRRRLILLDEMTAEEIAAIPPLPTPENRRDFERPLAAPAQPELEIAAPAIEWGASPNGPIVE